MTLPAAMTMGGIASTLSSRKLIVVLNKAIEDGSINDSEETVISAAFFIFALAEDNWPEQLSDLLSNRSNIWIIRNYLYFLMRRAFERDEAKDPGQQEILLRLCQDIEEKGTAYSSDAQRKQHRERIAQDMRQRRLRNRTRALTVIAR